MYRTVEKFELTTPFSQSSQHILHFVVKVNLFPPKYFRFLKTFLTSSSICSLLGLTIVTIALLIISYIKGIQFPYGLRNDPIFPIDK